jgi:hypothetical protein
MMATRTAAADRPREPLGTAERDVVEFALRAPSVHNTQPWRWRIGPARLDLYADRTRQLPVADPLGRNLVTSCGAALEYAAVGAAAAGWGCAVELLPDGGNADHLATLRLFRGTPSERAVAAADPLRARATDRGRFLPWPVSAGLLGQLADRSVTDTARAAPVTDVVGRCNVDLLISRAMATVRSDPRLVAEHAAWTWTTRKGLDGVPPLEARAADRDRHRRRPTRDGSAQPACADGCYLGAPTDGLVVILTSGDEPRGWLDTGRLLCRLWADALDHGLNLLPVSPVVEVDDTRAGLRRDVLRTDAHPQLLIRLGWRELGRSPLPRTPRRPLDDVLMR